MNAELAAIGVAATLTAGASTAPTTVVTGRIARARFREVNHDTQGTRSLLAGVA
jgi:hypothetical protein